MADGSVIIEAKMDTSKADKELAKLKKDIESTEGAISEQETKKSPLIEQANQLRSEMQKARAEVEQYKQAWISGVVGADTQQARAQERLNSITSEYEKIEAEIEKIDAKLIPAYEKLDGMKEKAGELQQNINRAAKNTKKMEKATKKADKHMGLFATRLRGILLSAFVFNILSRGFRELTEWMGSVIKTNDKARASIAKLKGALLTLAQPLVDVIVPAFASITDFLAQSVTYIAQLVAILFGTTADSASDAAKSLYDEQNAIDGVGTSAKKASKQLAAFDEINKINSDSASSVTDTIIPDFSSLEFRKLPEWLTDMTVTLRDILFEWENLTAEDVLKKVVAALTTLAGAVIGFSVGGIKGAAIGITVGASVGALLSSLLFDGDGVMNTEELLSSLCFALTTVAGGVLGFAVGGPFGAAIGVTVGAGVGVGISKMLFNGDGVMDTEELLKSLCAALFTIVGGVLGFVIGGPGGALLGATVGAGVSAYIGKLLFDNDGKMSQEEIVKSVCLALLSLVGGIIGFVVGGPAGAVMGVLIGATASVALSNFLFDGDGKVSKQELLKGLCVVLGALVGGIIGFAVGGPVGALIGATIGTAATLALTKVDFSSEKGQRIKQAIIDSLVSALYIAAGGVIGFAVGNVPGALIGMVVGAALTLSLKKVNVDDSGVRGFVNNFRGSGFTSTITTGNIPGFANGSVIPPNREFLAILGDNKQETEVVSPLSTMKQAMIEALRESGGSSGTYTFVVNLDGKEVARNQVKHINDMTRQAGKPVLLY